jgi:hypothetical protein
MTDHVAHDISNLDGLMAEIGRLNTAKGWRDHFPQDKPGPLAGPWFAAYCALATSEVSEALDEYRVKRWSETREDGKPIGVGPELADALIRLLDMIDIWDIDIKSELLRVLEYGWTRPYQHGGKVL